MVNNFTQLTLSDCFEHCKDCYQKDKPKFLQLLTENLDLSSLIPITFFWSYNKSLGRNRLYPLESMLSSLLLQKILGIPTVSLLIIFLTLCKEARDFCGFTSVPDNSQFTRFKQDFVCDINKLFNHLVDVTEPLCHEIDSKLASMIAFDTSGIEAYVTENNPKFANSIIKKLKRAYKNNPDVDVYKMAYGLMPSSASANKDVKQLYINGYFCYVYKFAIITNGLGIVRNITFLDEDFKSNHPEIVFDKKSDSPDEDKSVSDSKSLRPVLTDFFKQHPNTNCNTFLGDSIFDTYATYPMLLDEFKFKKVLIPLNPRNSNPNLKTPDFDENGWPLCSKDSSKTMKPTGWAREKGRSDRFKWVCPQSHRVGTNLITKCENPCNGKPCGRIFYTSPSQNQRMYPGVIRGSEEWIADYRIRTVVEQTIQYFKEPMCCGNPKTRDNLTIKSDLLLAGIAQQITVILADKINQRKYFRSLKPLIS